MKRSAPKHAITAKAPAPGTATREAVTTKAPLFAPTVPVRDDSGPQSQPKARTPQHPLWQFVNVLASLRLTVVLFALSIVLVFYGTWAQVDSGIWTVMSKYFRSAIVFIPLHVVLLRTIQEVPFYVPFPGGWLLGGLLLANVLAAHITRFRISWKRSGILVLHAGLILLMLGELVTGLFAIEGNLTFVEGQTVNYIDHPIYPEMAIVDSSNAKTDRITAISARRLQSGEPIINHPLTPFDVEVVRYMVNSRLLPDVDPARSNPATTGVGLRKMAYEIREGSGTETDQKIDTPSAYVKLKEKGTGKDLGTYLISYLVRDPQIVEVDGKKYDISLRFKRTVCDFQMKLLRADHDVYPGTRIAKNYASKVQLVDPKSGENREIKISMNDPLRYGGLTFYQSGMEDVGQNLRLSVLQVVRNPGWWIPYVSCVMVTLGMLIHFGLNLADFVNRKVLS